MARDEAGRVGVAGPTTRNSAREISATESDPDPGRARRGAGRPDKAQAIRQAAQRLFLDVGYGATSMDAVARAAGVSKATVYAHFTSKDKLFAAILEDGCRRRYGLTWPEVPPPERLKAALKEWARRFFDMLLSADGMALHRLVMAEAVRFPELGRAFYDGGPHIAMSGLENFFAALDARGDLRVADPHLAAQHFIGLIRGDLYLRRLLGLSGAPREAEILHVIDGGVEAFLRAYRAGV